MKKLSFLFALLLLSFVGTQVNAQTVFFQGFEIDASDWFEYPNVITRVASGTNGITSSSGSYHAVFAGTGAYGDFTRFDGYRSVWPGGFTASADIYLDLNWAEGKGFDYSVAANRNDGNHLRDFIFHVGVVGGNLLINGSGNTDFYTNSWKLLHENGGNYYTITQSGWYTFQHNFYDIGGTLTVDLNLLDASNNLLFTIALSNPTDLISSVVGGNRYGWFTFIDVTDGIAIDNTSLSIIPEPGTIILLGSGLLGLGVINWLRRRKA